MPLEFADHERLSLKNNPDFNEVWLYDLIAKDPTRLGLGEVEVIDRERIQDKAGRLDMLLSDPRNDRRYEVEIMLGATDPSHIIRCIEYWDIERRRYPAYEHIAVLIAEDITSRFVNVLSLFAGNIPLIAIQLNALKLESKLVLDFVRVLDQTSLRRDDVAEATGGDEVDRAYWQNRVGEQILGLCDRALGIINEKAEPAQQLNYKKMYIGLTDGVNRRNFVLLLPKKSFLHLRPKVTDADAWLKRFDEAGVQADLVRDRVQITIEIKKFAEREAMIREILHQAVEEHEA